MTHEEILAEAMITLLDARDFLGYQLGHARGGMTDDQLEEIAEEYLKETTDSREVLVEKAQVLKRCLGDRCTAEVLATLLKCTIEVGFELEASSL